MKKIFLFAVLALATGLLNAQNRSEQEISDEVLLELYKDARLTDVLDAMVTCGYMEVGLMAREISPLWRDIETMEHRFSGIALTVRYAPTNHPKYPGEDLTKPENYQVYRDWRDMWYSQMSHEPFVPLIKKGTVIVMDNRDDNDTGSTGSRNIMGWQKQGAVGLVAAGGVRDIDEIIRQKNPVYMDYNRRGRGERIGRNEFIDMQQPVVVGGVLVYPGDIVVADSDGVIVVPRRVAVRVGQIAYMELVSDMAGRKMGYEETGRKLDASVIIREEPADFFKRLGLPIDPNGK